MSRLTLFGMYDYDPTLFDGLVMPDRFNHDDVVNVILEKCGDLYPYYQVPSWLKNNMTVWARRMYHQFERMIDVLYEDYDPLENYNRYENSTDTPRETVTTTHSGSDSETHSGSDTETHSGSDTETHSGIDTETNSGSDTVTGNTTITTQLGSTTTASANKAAFDSGAYQPVDQTITTTSGGDTSTENRSDTTQHGHIVTDQHGHIITDQHGHIITDKHGHVITDQHGHVITEVNSGNHEFASRIHGNIGVTTSQQMLEAELATREFDIYDKVAEIFAKQFMIRVY